MTIAQRIHCFAFQIFAKTDILLAHTHTHECDLYLKMGDPSVYFRSVLEQIEPFYNYATIPFDKKKKMRSAISGTKML